MDGREIWKECNISVVCRYGWPPVNVQDYMTQWRAGEAGVFTLCAQGAVRRRPEVAGAVLRSLECGYLCPAAGAQLGEVLLKAGDTREALALLMVAQGMAWDPNSSSLIATIITACAAHLFHERGAWATLWEIRGVRAEWVSR